MDYQLPLFLAPPQCAEFCMLLDLRGCHLGPSQVSLLRDSTVHTSLVKTIQLFWSYSGLDWFYG